MEREIKLLKDKVQELSQENVALREINIQFQLENFKLKQKIKNFEKSQFGDYNFGEESTKDMTLTETTFDPSAEYLEEAQIELPTKKTTRERLGKRPVEAIKDESEGQSHYEFPQHKQEFFNLYGYEEGPPIESNISELKSELLINNKEDVSELVEITPKAAAEQIYMLAAKRGIMHIIRAIKKGKEKDSSFVNKTLDLVFDRETLASSSARGKKCQAMLYKSARPALDAQKLEICRQAFMYRLKQEGISVAQADERFRQFYGYVNFKIQNARKLNKKSVEKFSVSVNL